jgi:hypothetical protein
MVALRVKTYNGQLLSSDKSHGNKQLTRLTSDPCGQHSKKKDNHITQGTENMTAC